MGVLGAFVFAAQMVNFAIPGTGSSGHIGGGLLLSAILGPHAALVVMASVLTVQALFFADGGLLALGCNIVNLGLFTCYVAYPLVFRPLAGASPTRGRLTGAALVAAVFGLTLGALAVVVETTFSGVSQLPFGPFALVMVPIHAAIGVVEGIVTAGVVLFVWRARPDLLRLWDSSSAHGSLRALLITFAAVAVLLGAVVSWFASSQPDGLEWSLGRVAGTEAPAGPERSQRGLLTRLQKRTAILPDYSLRPAVENRSAEGSWPAPDAGASLSGVLGAGLTLLVALGAGYGLHRARSRNRADPPTRTS
jgi:cobalt/nickel transport system permease protein